MAINKKVCIIGAFAAGKSSLVRRYVLNQFSPDYQATLGVNISKFSDEVESPGGERTTINQILWDIEGSQEGEGLLEAYLRGASGALVVGDITRNDVTKTMEAHARRFLDQLPGRPLVFALNKVDLVQGEVDPDLGHGLVESFGGELIHSSAASGESVPSLFRALARRILEVGA